MEAARTSPEHERGDVRRLPPPVPLSSLTSGRRLLLGKIFPTEHPLAYWITHENRFGVHLEVCTAYVMTSFLEFVVGRCAETLPLSGAVPRIGTTPWKPSVGNIESPTRHVCIAALGAWPPVARVGTGHCGRTAKMAWPMLSYQSSFQHGGNKVTTPLTCGLYLMGKASCVLVRARP